MLMIIREFARLYETEPQTDAELFRIVLNRLTDIKDDVEWSDNTLREEVQHGANEYVLRRWLARKLEERSRQRYTIAQEEEIDQEERPDLRAENPRTAPVSIELKWGDNWTLAQLLERLENQLVGQYLRAERSRYGIYVLATDGRQRYWRSPDGNLTFGQVIERVVGRAGELRTTLPASVIFASLPSTSGFMDRPAVDQARSPILLRHKPCILSRLRPDRFSWAEMLAQGIVAAHAVGWG